ncbi:hypothetical protein DL768_002231 [Monosporascus sp. mg162]|nr:hypothetical protein DL768_002231 [Monosporascus sp. mg162]
MPPPHGSGPDEYEMVTSPKVLLPTSNKGAVVSSGPQFRGSGDAALPEPAWTISEDTSSQPASALEVVMKDAPEVAMKDAPEVVMKDAIEWEVPVNKTKATDRVRKYKHWYCCWGCCGFWGLSRGWRWTVGVLATLVLLAIIGGAVGGSVARNLLNSGPYWSGSGRTSTIDDAWEFSKLAALSWTDSANATRRAVFYQLEGALMLRLYHSGNQSWTPHNISADFAPQDLNVPNVKTATPLAVAATPPPPHRNSDVPFAAALYYMNMDNEIREVVSYDEDLAEWAYGEDHPPRTAADYTQLAAAADFCSTGCRDAFCYAYQDRDQRVLFACGDDWNNATRLDGAHPGGALALIPVAAAQSENDGGDGDGDNARPHELRLFHYTDTNVKMFRIRNDSSWDLGEQTVLSSLEPATEFFNNPAHGLLPPVVAAPSGADLADMFAFAIGGENRMVGVASWYNGTAGEWAERDRQVAFGGTSNSSADDSWANRLEAVAIAMDYDGSFYVAVVGWAITRHVWDPEVDPFALEPAEVIDISESTAPEKCPLEDDAPAARSSYA